MKIDWSSLWRKDDWWAVWIGFAILLLGVAHWLPSTPKFGKWLSVAQSLPDGLGGTLVPSIAFLVFILVLTDIGMAVMKQSVRQDIPGFLEIGRAHVWN